MTSQIVPDSTPATDASLNQGDTLVSTSSCPSGTAMLGGGYQFTHTVALGDLPKLTTRQNFPSASNTWTAQIVVNSGASGSVTLTAYVVCTV